MSTFCKYTPKGNKADGGPHTAKLTVETLPDGQKRITISKVSSFYPEMTLTLNDSDREWFLLRLRKDDDDEQVATLG